MTAGIREAGGRSMGSEWRSERCPDQSANGADQ